MTMAMYNTEDESNSPEYFKPERYVNYKAKIGKFVVTSKKDENGNKEVEEYDNLTFYNVIMLYKAVVKDVCSSVKCNLFGSKGIYGKKPQLFFGDDFSKLGLRTIEKKEFAGKKGGSYEAWSVDGDKISVEACLVGVLENGLTCEIQISGYNYGNIFFLTDEMRQDKLKENPQLTTLKEGNIISFVPRKEKITVGKVPKTAEVYLFDVAKKDGDIPTDIKETCDAVYAEIKRDLDKENLEDDESDSEPTKDVELGSEEDTIPEKAKKSQEESGVDISDVPF